MEREKRRAMRRVASESGLETRDSGLVAGDSRFQTRDLVGFQDLPNLESRVPNLDTSA